MSGIPFRVNGKGQVLVSWMSRGKAYWSISDEEAAHFGPRIAAPEGGGQEQLLPMAVGNERGEVLLVWLKGKQVAWALYGMDGKFSGKQGVAGEQTSDNKPTAFVGADDNFTIVF
jgi:hypothetical protein